MNTVLEKMRESSYEKAKSKHITPETVSNKVPNAKVSADT